MLLHITLKAGYSQMTKQQIKLFFKFNKYSIIETFWSVSGVVMDVFILRHWGWHLSPHWWLNIIYIFLAFWPLFGLYRAYVSWKTYSIRKEDYLRCTEMFKKYGVKKSILYNLQTEPCSQEVAKQLEKDFDVKDLEKIND